MFRMRCAVDVLNLQTRGIVLRAYLQPYFLQQRLRCLYELGARASKGIAQQLLQLLRGREHLGEQAELLQQPYCGGW